MEIILTLEQYGLKPHEAKIYCYLLKAKEAGVYDIARETKIARTSVYNALETLKERNIVSTFRKNGVLYFCAENPERLIKDLKDKERMIESILPDMKKLSESAGSNPTIRFYTGKDGVKTVLDDMLETFKKENIKKYYAASLPEVMDHFPKYVTTYLKKREELGVFAQVLLPESAKSVQPEYLPSNSMRETRYMPANFPLKSFINIYGSKVAFFSLHNNEIHSLIIESAAIKDSMLQFFLFTWEMLGSKEKQS